jgi:uncharacterized repeat protein (TIGR01451 family)
VAGGFLMKNRSSLRTAFEGVQPSVRAILVVLIIVASIFAVMVTIVLPSQAGSTIGVVTLGNQERQDITADNQWVNGNIDFWLESHLYDTEVRLDAGTSPTPLPSTMDIGMSFFFSNNNAIVIDWTQDWSVTFNQQVMYWTKTTVPTGGSFQCTTPPNIASIPVNGRSILVPEAGSVCIKDVAANTTGNPTTGWADLMSLPMAQLNQVLPKRNEPCNSQAGGLCVSGAETESSPVTEHYFRVNLTGLFGPSGVYPQSWWPNLPAGQHLAIYFRNHLAMTSVWDTTIGGSGGGSQPQFCISTPIGAILNTNYNRCGWTTVSRFGAGAASGSKNHGDVFAPGIGDKTIPLPQVISPSGFITVCKIVTPIAYDQTGAKGNLTNNWTIQVTGPFSTNQTKLTGSFSLGCAKFGPLFPESGYLVTEVLKQGFINLGTVVNPSTSRDPSSGTNPNPANPVSVTITFTQANAASGPVVTFVNFQPTPNIASNCSVAITDNLGNPVTRGYAIAGDTVTLTYTVTNTGNDALTVFLNHTNTVIFGPNPLFTGVLQPGQTASASRSHLVTTSDSGLISDFCSATGFDQFNTVVSSTSHDCNFVVRAPHVSFTKYPQAADNVFVVPGQHFTYRITVTNSGDAPANVTVSDALGAGQELLNGGANTSAGDLPSVAPTSPAAGADYPAPVTITWSGLTVAPGTTIFLNFTVLVTSTVDGAQLTGTMTLTATNQDGVSYTPNPNTAGNLITVTRPILKLSQFGYTNTPNGTPVQGVTTGITVYTIVFTNYGNSTATLTGSFVVTVSGQGAGTFDCKTSSAGVSLSGCSLTFSGVTIAPGKTFSFQLTIEYNSFASGAQIAANLGASYTTAGSPTVYVPSGVPAEIIFTVQGS